MPAHAAAPHGSTSTSRNGHPRGLVVDDEASIRDLLCKTLQLAEYEVETAPDGGAALTRLRAMGSYERFDLVIADLKMPGMDGLTLIKEVKQLKLDLPVIIITGYSSEKAAIDAVNLGVSGYLTKPFRIPQVLEAAAKALGAPAA
jgi:two-component system response regulator FlrC